MARRPTTERLSERKQRHNVNPMRDKIHRELCIYQRPFLKRHPDESLNFFTLSTDALVKSDIFKNSAKFSFIQKVSLDLLMAGTPSEKKTEQLANFRQLSVFDHASVLVNVSTHEKKPVAILVGTNDTALHHAHAIWSWYLARYKQELPIILFGFKLSAGDEHVYRHGFIKPTQLVNYIFKQSKDSLIQVRRLENDSKALEKQFKVKEEELARLKATAAQPDAATAELEASLKLELNRLKPQLIELQAQLREAVQMAAAVEPLQRHVRALEDAQAASVESQAHLQGWVEYYRGLAESSGAALANIQPEYERLRLMVAQAGPTDPRLSAEEKIAGFQHSIRGFQQRIRELEDQRQGYARQLVSMGNDLEKAQAESQALQLIKTDLEKNIEKLGRGRSSYERDVDQLHRQLRERNLSITKLTEQRKILLERQVGNHREIKRLGGVLGETLRELDAVKAERDALKARAATVKPLEIELTEAQALHVRDVAALAEAKTEIQQLRTALDKVKAEQKREKRVHARAAHQLARIAAAGIVIHDSEAEDDIPLAKRAKQPRQVEAPAAAAATPMGASASPCSAGGAGMFATQPHVRAARTPSPYKQLLAQSVDTSAGRLSVSQVQGELASALNEVTQNQRKIGDRLTTIHDELKALSVYFRDLKAPEEAAANQAYEYVLSIKFWVSYLLYQPDYNAQQTPADLQCAFEDINIDTSRLPLPLYLIAADAASANWTKDRYAIAPRRYGDIRQSRKSIVARCDELNLLPISALKQLDKADGFINWYKSQLKGSTFTRLMWTHLTWRAVSKTDSPNKPAICQALVDLQHQLVTKFNQRLAASSASVTPSFHGEGAAAAAAQPLTFQP